MKTSKLPNYRGHWPQQLNKHQELIQKAHQLAPELFDWVGIYYKTDYLNEDLSETLQLGPYIGSDTEHTRIPFNQGICGLSMTEEKTINVKNVADYSEYLACSLETKSEIVIPLKDIHGKIVAELDIDSHTINAFSQELESNLEKLCEDYSDSF